MGPTNVRMSQVAFLCRESVQAGPITCEHSSFAQVVFYAVIRSSSLTAWPGGKSADIAAGWLSFLLFGQWRRERHGDVGQPLSLFDFGCNLASIKMPAS